MYNTLNTPLQTSALIVLTVTPPSSSVSSLVAAGSGGDLVFRFQGRGWGHGVGLCQIGACTLAREGASAETILGFYYPGTKVVKASR